MIARHDVEFAGEAGVILRGWLFLPPGAGMRAAVSMCHGFAAVKEHALERYALELVYAASCTGRAESRRNLTVTSSTFPETRSCRYLTPTFPRVALHGTKRSPLAMR